ncbi:MAG: hypothetical protein Q8P27_02115 [Candidatus Peregrinibacteria bacterium]|nr:hypothetical protein [Candidatus Peregrinibacteria bacterium]
MSTSEDPAVDRDLTSVLETLFPVNEPAKSVETSLDAASVSALFPHLPDDDAASVIDYLNEDGEENRQFRIVISRLLQHLAQNHDFESRWYILRRMSQIIGMILDNQKLTEFMAQVRQKIEGLYVSTSEIRSLLGQGAEPYPLKSVAAMLLQEIPQPTLRSV